MDKGMTRQDIIRAALRAWGRKVYQSTSLGDVARELGVSKTALYRHFTGKEELVEAMDEYFYDDYASFLKPCFETALKVPDRKEAILLMVRGTIEYYVRNRDVFIFSLTRIYHDREQDVAEQMSRRGFDVEKLRPLWGAMQAAPSLDLLLVTSLIFRIGHFHKYECGDAALSGGQIRQVMAEVEEKLNSGLALDKNRIEALEYERLETLAAGALHESATDESNSLLRAVGAVVAEAGPWNASMEMVARRSGLSKSGLYAHFRNKQDMLRRLFFTEFERIAGQARKSVGLSDIPEEQLYLGIFSIASYLRSRPEILVAMNWVRTRRLNLGHPPKSGEFQVFREIAIETLRNDENESWIFFLVLGTMMRRFKKTAAPMLRNTSPEEDNFSDLSNRSIRRLYRFVCLGFRDFEG
jgi:AcrR family transcriptional regulator